MQFNDTWILEHFPNGIPEQNPAPERIQERDWNAVLARVNGRQTYKAIAEAAGVSTERARQMIAKGLRIYLQIERGVTPPERLVPGILRGTEMKLIRAGYTTPESLMTVTDAMLRSIGVASSSIKKIREAYPAPAMKRCPCCGGSGRVLAAD